MPPTDNPKTRSRSAPIAALVLAAMLVLYPLSIGPAWWLVEREVLSIYALQDFYVPVYWAYDYLPSPARKAINWYVNLWTESVFIPAPIPATQP